MIEMGDGVELEAGPLHGTGEFLLWSVPHMLSCAHVQTWAKWERS